MEVLGNTQDVNRNANIVFDVGSADSVGNNIVLDPSGTTFTINRTGLYHVEWNMNLSNSTPSAVVGIIENGEPASGAACSAAGSFSSGTLIEVTSVPFTLSLFNFNNDITIENPVEWEDAAVSIRIVRFSDGASM